jgi:hypothetical protein
MVGRKRVVLGGFLISAVVFCCHNFIGGLSSLFIFRGLAGIGVGIIPGSLAALAWGGSIGFFTALGSLGFTAGNFLAGVLQEDFFIFSGASLLCLVGFVGTLFVKEKRKKIAVPLLPIRMVKKNLYVYLPFLIRHSAAQAIWAIFPIYLAGLGASKLWIGIIYGVNPLMQVVFMLCLDRFKSTRLITWGLIASSVTFLGYGIAPNWHIILFFQIILGFSWANLYLGSVKYLLENNIEQATAIGFLNSIIGLAGILGPLIGGALSFLGMRALLFGSASLALSGFIIAKIRRPQVA